MPNAVYDPDTEGEQKYHPPNLDSLDNKPAGDPSDPRTIHKNRGDRQNNGSEPRSDLRDAENSGDNFFNPHDEEETNGKPSTASALAGAESGFGRSKNEPGSGFKFNKDDSSDSGFKKTLRAIAKHKKGVGIGIGAGGGVASIALMVFFIMIPMKIEHIVQNLEHRFFATSEDAVQKESERMLQRYLITHVFPTFKDGNCGSTIDRHCKVTITGKGPISNLYRTWANDRLETKLAEKHGIEFKYHKSSNTWYLKAPGTVTPDSPDGDNIGKDGAGLETDFRRSNRQEVLSTIHDAYKSETRWQRMMYRFPVGKLMEERYGTKRYVFYNGKGNILGKAGDKIAEKKIAAKLILNQRVVMPRNQTMGIVIECLLTDCSATDTHPSDDPDSPSLHGAPENAETDTKVREGLTSLAAKYGATNIGELVDNYKKISEEGFQKYFIDKVMGPIIGRTASGAIGDAIPVVGWMDLAARIINSANDAGKTLIKLRYLANAPAAVNTYFAFRTYADEIHTGHPDATELGSMTNALGPGNHGDPNDPIVGGTVGAENTPLYKNLIDNDSGSSSGPAVSLLSGLLPSASAASNDNKYLCSSGKPVPTDQLICPEEYLGGGNSIANGVHDWLNSDAHIPVPGAVGAYITPSSIVTVAQAWRDSIGKIFDIAGGVLGTAIHVLTAPANLSCGLPSWANPFAAYCAAKDAVSGIIPAIVDGITKALIPNPTSTNMSGGRTFDEMAIGADVAGNDYAHTGLGGRRLNPTEVADIVNQQESERQKQFNGQSIFARMFDTSSQYSLVSRVAMAIPFGLQADAQSGLASVLNPLSAISHGFGSILSDKADADVAPKDDFAGVTQYGWTDRDIERMDAQIDAVGNGDGEAYWDKYCSDNPAYGYMKDNSWNEAASGDSNADPNTGMPVNTTTNPCLLLRAVISTGGGYMDTSNLTPDEQTVLNGGSAAAGGGGPTDGGGGPVSGDAQQLAQQILQQAKNGKIVFNVLNSADQNDGSTPEDNIKETANGQPAQTTSNCSGRGAQPPNSTVQLNTDLLKFILELSQQTTIQINALAGQCHSSSSSNHYKGVAVDFGCPLDVTAANQVGQKYGISDKTGETCGNSAHYHYSVGGY